MANLPAGSANSMFFLSYTERAQETAVQALSSPNTPKDSTPIVPLLWTVFASILEVFILCFAGWILARRGIIDKKTQKQLNRINVSLFTPSLLFSKVAFALSPQKLKELWIIPILFVVVTTVSALVAWVFGHLLRLKRTQRNFAIAAAMFNNSNSLPIALMQSLVITVHGLKWGKDDNKDAMLGRALSYLVLYSTLGMMLRWSFGVHLLSKADDEVVLDAVDEEAFDPTEDEPRNSVTFSLPDERTPLSPGLVAGLSRVDSSSSSIAPEPPHMITAPPPPHLEKRPTNKGRRPSFFYSFPNTPTRSRVDLTVTPPDDDDEPPVRSPDPAVNLNDEWGGVLAPGAVATPPSTRIGSLARRTKTRISKAWKGINEFMTVPLWAALASLIVACIRPFQHALEAHMQPVKGSLVAAGNCSIPVTLIVLGAYFHTPAPETPVASLPASVPNGVHDESPSERRKKHWSGSEMSIATLTDSLKGAFKLRGFKKDDKKYRVEAAHKGEAATVFVAVLSRMILAPAFVLPAVIALARYDIQRVTDDPVFVVSMVLLVSSPPALTLAQITQAASGDAFERLISKTIFWSYCVFTPPLTILYVVIGLLIAKL